MQDCASEHDEAVRQRAAFLLELTAQLERMARGANLAATAHFLRMALAVGGEPRVATSPRLTMRRPSAEQFDTPIANERLRFEALRLAVERAKANPELQSWQVLAMAELFTLYIRHGVAMEATNE